jgi:hypothetical protein
VNLWRRWLGILTPRNLCLLSGILAATYLAATVTSYVRFFDRDQAIDGGGLIGGDYAAFYAAGRLALEGRLAHLYDSGVVRAVQEAAVEGRVPDIYIAFRNPPFVAALLAPFAAVDLLFSFALWSLFSIALLVLAVRLSLFSTPRLRRHWPLVALAVAGFCPVYTGLADGQNAIVSLLLFVLVYRALRNGHDAQAGAWAALGLFKPQLFFILPIVFLASRKWRALLAYSGVAAALALASLALVGMDGLVAWARIIVEFEPANAARLAGRMYSFKAFFDVLLPEQSHIALGLAVACSLAVLAALFRVWSTPRALSHDVRLRWIFTMLVVLLVDPHLLDYDLTILVLPGLLMIGLLPETAWWMAPLFVITAIDAPLSLGPVSLQLGVVLLTTLAVRVFWRLEQSRPPRLVTNTKPIPDFALHGGARATQQSPAA